MLKHAMRKKEILFGNPSVDMRQTWLYVMFMDAVSSRRKSGMLVRLRSAQPPRSTQMFYRSALPNAINSNRAYVYELRLKNQNNGRTPQAK